MKSMDGLVRRISGLFLVFCYIYVLEISGYSAGIKPAKCRIERSSMLGRTGWKKRSAKGKQVGHFPRQILTARFDSSLAVNSDSVPPSKTLDQPAGAPGSGPIGYIDLGQHCSNIGAMCRVCWGVSKNQIADFEPLTSIHWISDLLFIHM